MTSLDENEHFLVFGEWLKPSAYNPSRVVSFFKRTRSGVSMDDIQKEAGERFPGCPAEYALLLYYKEKTQEERDLARDVGDVFTQEEYDSLTFLMSLQRFPE
jgi:hypothetical protein